MGIVSRSVDIYYTYRFLRLLTTKWKDMDAFKLGIIDENGKPLKKASQLMKSEEKDAYTVFHRMVFNVKRLIEIAPGGKSNIASFAAALYLIKENTQMTDEQIKSAIVASTEDDSDNTLEDILSEGASQVSWFILGDDSLAPGSYDLKRDIASPVTGEVIARKGTRVVVDEGTKPSGLIFEEPIYRIRHIQTGTDIFVCAEDITR